MRFEVYKNSLRYGLSQVTNYRSEVWVTIVSKFVYILSIVFLWSIVGKSSNGIEGVSSLLSYFLIANGVQGLVDAESLRFSKALNAAVKTGELSAHLLRPVNPVLFIYSNFLGTRGVTMLMTVILMLTGFVFLPTVSVWQVVLFAVSLVLALVVGFVFNLFVGSLSFWTPEANHLQNVISHVLRVFCGVLIPISFFTGYTKTLLLLSPFPALGYLPSMIMQSKAFTFEMYLAFGSAVFWAVVLLPLSFWFWKKGVKIYEAVGI